jgi:hypothetical protein
VACWIAASRPSSSRPASEIWLNTSKFASFFVCRLHFYILSWNTQGIDLLSGPLSSLDHCFTHILLKYLQRVLTVWVEIQAVARIVETFLKVIYVARIVDPVLKVTNTASAESNMFSVVCRSVIVSLRLLTHIFDKFHPGASAYRSSAGTHHVTM